MANYYAVVPAVLITQASGSVRQLSENLQMTSGTHYMTCWFAIPSSKPLVSWRQISIVLSIAYSISMIINEGL